MMIIIGTKQEEKRVSTNNQYHVSRLTRLQPLPSPFRPSLPFHATQVPGHGTTLPGARYSYDSVGCGTPPLLETASNRDITILGGLLSTRGARKEQPILAIMWTWGQCVRSSRDRYRHRGRQGFFVVLRSVPLDMPQCSFLRPEHLDLV